MILYDGIRELTAASREGRLPRFFRLKTKEGVYEVRVNDIGIFSTLIEKYAFDGELEYNEGVHLFLPRIDTALLVRVIGSFQAIYRSCGNLEAVAHVYWDPAEKTYYVHCPRQIISRYSIDLEWDNGRCERHVLVLEIHSHHIMPATFSPTDDEYEKAARFYAVVGKVDRFFPEVRLRYANARTHREVPPETLFETRFPVEWLRNLRAAAPAKGAAGGD